MSIFDEISPDPNKPLSVDEFKRAFNRFKDSVMSSDKDLARFIAEVDTTKLKKDIEDSIREAKFTVYRRIFWDKVEKLQWD